MTRLNRRDFLVGAVTLGLGASSCAPRLPRSPSTLVNDMHSQLNPTRVDRVIPIDSLDTLRRVVHDARANGKAISIAGGRHAAGGQQFGAGAVVADMTPMNRVLSFDPARGEIEVEAGIQWPALIEYTVAAQRGQPHPWGIIQKQGIDRITIGGTLAANAHGSGLGLKPFIGDVEAFTLLDAGGELRRCSRRENPELFRLAIGGYGLFGIVTSVRLRLAPRRVLQRVVELRDVETLVSAFERRQGEGFLYGNFQYVTDARSDDFTRRGVLSVYGPAPAAAPMPEDQPLLSDPEWKRLIQLAHTDKARAFRFYADRLQAASDQTVWSDTHQRGAYVDDYHRWLDEQSGARHHATEILIEFFVPRPALAPFLEDARRDFLEHRVDVIFGTIRMIEADDESFLPWARWPGACVVFNLHTEHTAHGVERAAQTFRRLVDLAAARGGTYFLTYHRFATRAQVEASHPRFVEFLRRKRAYDPEERFQSDWYRHYKTMFADVL